jgi:hypothetical protein
LDIDKILNDGYIREKEDCYETLESIIITVDGILAKEWMERLKQIICKKKRNGILAGKKVMKTIISEHGLIRTLIKNI